MGSPTINRLMRDYYDSPLRAHERLGQWFVNRYIKEPWPELFYEENDRVAIDKIHQWLIDCCYEHKMPPLIHR